MKQANLVYRYDDPCDCWKFVVFADGEQELAVTGEVYRPESYLEDTITIQGFCKTTFTTNVDGERFRQSPIAFLEHAMETMARHFRPDIIINRVYEL